MSKHKPIGHRQPRTTVTYRGITYRGVKKNGKIIVRADNTAHGQNIVVGVYDPVADTWHNDNSRIGLPDAVRSCFVYALT